MKVDKTQFIILIVVVSVGIFFSTVRQVGAPYIEKFTPDERALLDKHWSTGLYTGEEWGKIILRIFRDPKREGAIERAFRNSLTDRFARDFADVGRAVRDPRIIGIKIKDFFSRTNPILSESSFQYNKRACSVRIQIACCNAECYRRHILRESS